MIPRIQYQATRSSLMSLEDSPAMLTELFGARGQVILHRMQKVVISSMLNIARTFKIVS